MALSLEQYKSPICYGHKIKDMLMKRLDKQREVSLGASFNNGDCIPEHLIIEILSWLPAKALLQFKSVCKQWYSIIKSSHFISKHLRNYYDNDSNWRDCLIVQYSITQAGKHNVYELLVDEWSKRVLSYQLIEIPIYNAYMCGPCDGLYFLGHRSGGPRPSLWNPTLNEFKILPNINLKSDRPSYMTLSREAYGFGFDSDTKDYKVIVIQCYRDDRDIYSSIINYPSSVYIYSLKSNSWRYWGDLKNSFYLEQNKSYVFINGCYYWLGSRECYEWNYEVVISFDITADAYEEIPLPKFEKEPCYGSQLVVYHDCIAFVCVAECQTIFSIWTWNERGWTQKLIMELGFEVWGAFSHWWDNMLVFRVASGKLVLCDTDTLRVWPLKYPQARRGIENIVIYKESLVSIKDEPEKQCSDVVTISDWFWPEICVTEEIPDWFWPDLYGDVEWVESNE